MCGSNAGLEGSSVVRCWIKLDRSWSAGAAGTSHNEWPGGELAGRPLMRLHIAHLTKGVSALMT